MELVAADVPAIYEDPGKDVICDTGGASWPAISLPKKSAIYNAIKPLDFQVVVTWLDVPFIWYISWLWTE